jgi:uncharacterized protein (DUF433 family)
LNRPSVSDLREMPLYAASEAARYLHLPVSTVRAWAFGQGYQVRDQHRHFKPVINIADSKARRLSFLNLVELLVLAAIRRKHHVPLPQVRSAVKFLRKRFPSKHPLADHQFQTDGVDLFVEKFGQLVNLSRNGQVAIKDLIQQYLKLVERDASGVPIKLHLPRAGEPTKPIASVVIDPQYGFGRPVLEGRGIRTDVIVERFNAGESIASLANDYSLSAETIEDILRSQQPLAA